VDGLGADGQGLDAVELILQFAAAGNLGQMLGLIDQEREGASLPDRRFERDP